MFKYILFFNQKNYIFLYSEEKKGLTRYQVKINNDEETIVQRTIATWSNQDVKHSGMNEILC